MALPFAWKMAAGKINQNEFWMWNEMRERISHRFYLKYMHSSWVSSFLFVLFFLLYAFAVQQRYVIIPSNVAIESRTKHSNAAKLRQFQLQLQLHSIITTINQLYWNTRRYSTIRLLLRSELQNRSEVKTMAIDKNRIYNAKLAMFSYWLSYDM